MTRVAAFDCGTNSLRLLVADLDPATGEMAELVREMRIVRLGQGVDRTGRISEESMARTFAALDEYAALVAGHRPERMRFCATSAARDAANAADFMHGVKARLGVEPEVIDGDGEARASFAGVTRVLGDVPGPVLVLDIGGGSTELILGSPDGTVEVAQSLDVGSVRMTERHLHDDPPTAAQVAALRADVDARIAEMDRRKAEYQDWLKRRDDFLKQAEAGLTDIYKKMKPDAAALQLQDVKVEVAAAVIMRLGARQSSQILNEMDPEKAAVIANIIASASDPNTSKDPS